MGFFSSRKAEDNESYQVAIGLKNDKSSVVQVIRSRFYGKKGKEREDPTPTFRGGASTAQVLSSASSHQHIGASPVAASPTRGGAGPSILRNHSDRSLPPIPSTPSKKQVYHAAPDSPTPTRIKDTPGPSAHSQHVKTTSVASSSRKNTDTVTATLAQRLNELSVANSEGLLTDDEYRILRQNLFERFSSNATIPIEAPLVPASPQPRPRRVGQASERPPSRPVSNFQVERPLSISSKTSGAFGVTDLIRRATGRTSKDNSDTASVWSSTSNTSFFKIPGLTRKSSNSSVRTNASRSQADTMSLTSKRMAGSSDRGHSESLKSPASRSAASIRKLAAPPSSFHGSRGVAPEPRTANSMYNTADEEHLMSVKDITQEIANLEAEAKRLMDAFTGLEVTTLAKAQRGHVRPSLRSVDFGKNSTGESTWGVDSDGPSQRRINLADDAISMRSGTSVGTTPSLSPSVSRSAYSAKKMGGRTKLSANAPIGVTGASISRAGSLHRKNSSSSVASDGKRPVKVSMAPPVPALPAAIAQIQHLKSASVSNISLARSTGHAPMNTVPEDELVSASGTIKSLRVNEELESEMDDIRRRREEVSRRYDARLEYLRAKLKGAQLHERLMRK
ncbi:hypothetical protein HYPSUDRAFT_146447 [Hypholoma sublateritium FD-334 SS-4]|uniref:Uncharacterized protein n=1 Tax=Hypholoma sublateritium (strain FD-334 SS-4) TaxID=945553 RepID=A0A0D2PAW4_HYPSF|nr:hypothetical protein HYPSUDRAFT_146447 [Hypholoma sublateritium FD-334 SS-4]